MEITLPNSKKYIAAISGGVDSMVLLNLLARHKDKNNWEIIVAHVDHGIRHDSLLDKELVEKTANLSGLKYESISLGLNQEASEDLARTKRYQFLEMLAAKHQADAVITAHHQDDLLETAILNIVRGTGRKGLTSLINNDRRLRPLINYSKAEIIDYAKSNSVMWREDSTNTDPRYLRNYIRLNIMPRLNTSARSKLINILNDMSGINIELDKELSDLISRQSKPNELDRIWFSLLPHALAREVLATWLRQNQLAGFNKLTLERLVVSAKVARVKQSFPIYSDKYLIINKSTLSLSS